MALAAPHERATFERCKLDHQEREAHAEIVAMHRDLLRLRLELRLAGRRPEGSVLNEDCFVLRWDDLLLVVNLGRDLALTPAPEPLLAPPRDRSQWANRWSSEDPRYGGGGIIDCERDGEWHLPGHAAVLLRGA